MGRRESNPGGVTLILSGPTAVHDATQAAQEFGLTAGLGDSDRSRLSILVEELVTNLYEHGGVMPDALVELGLFNADDGINLTLIDPGQPFDPRSAPDNPAAVDRGGGAGLRLVNAWASITDYRTTPGRNVMQLTLPVQTGSRSEPSP